MTIRYRPGDWFSAVTPLGFALLPADLSLTLVEGIWGRVAGGAGLGGVLEALTGAFGTSLSSIPSFAVVAVTGDEARLAVRGPLSVRVQATDGAITTVSGLGVTTWSERVIPDVARVDITLDTAADGGPWFPLASGIVQASAVQLVLATTSTGPTPVPSIAADEVAQAPAAAALAPEPAAEPAAAIEPEAAAQPAAAAQPEPVPAPAPAAEPDAATPFDDAAGITAVEPADDTWLPAAETERTGLIDSIPPVFDSRDRDDEWDATVLSPAAAGSLAASTSAGAADLDDTELSPRRAPAGEAPVARGGDHDGETISIEQLRALRGDASAVPLGDEPVPAATGGSGWLEVSTGERVELDRPVVIGRRPRAVRVTGGVLPHLIAVPSPQQDISRSHVEIRREGDALLVVDLDTTNGTILLRGGASPTRLHPQDATMLVEDDVIDLGDGVTVTVRGIG